MNIIFDFDGTLIDSRLRLYSLFQDLVPHSRLSFEQYWSFKYSRYSNQDILKFEFGFEEGDVQLFLKDWMALIESSKYLSLDKNIEGVLDVLREIKLKASLHVCTDRQFRQPVLDQLDGLGLTEYFSSVMVTEQKRTKESMVFLTVRDLQSHDWMIGDTGKDIQVGKTLGINTCAVLSGFMSREALLKYKPTQIIDSVSQFSNLEL